MMKKINGVLVVEGKSDVSYLSSFINTLFFTTNGYDINEEKIAFLKEAVKVNKVIVFTDDDKAGETIRNKIKTEINGVFDAKIDANSRKDYLKNGVAEASKESILKALDPYFTEDGPNKVDYDLAGFISLSKDPSSKREEIIKKYRLIDGNNKALENQLRILKISKEELWK